MNRSILKLARRLAAALSVALVLGMIVSLAALGHGADPALGGGAWYANQTVPYTWAPGQVPPAWLQGAFTGAAGDSNRTRASRAAVFTLQSSGSSLVAYGEPTGCSASGIACFSRSAPGYFRVWYRAHGYRFDWGTLLWCQGPSGYVDGCYDAENIGLDELGHVQGLGHHVNYTDDRDYPDAVVQTVSRARPRTGWNAHAYGTCDVARLQLIYDRQTTWDRFSSCLSLATTTGLSASSTSAWLGTSVTFTATLRTTVSSAAGALSGDPISGRTVLLERRFPGGSAWTTVATMRPQPGSGSYAASATITGTYEWRATFPKPSGEGIWGSSSASIQVGMLRCTTCPNAQAAASGRAR